MVNIHLYFAAGMSTLSLGGRGRNNVRVWSSQAVQSTSRRFLLAWDNTVLTSFPTLRTTTCFSAGIRRWLSTIFCKILSHELHELSNILALHNNSTKLKSDFKVNYFNKFTRDLFNCVLVKFS